MELLNKIPARILLELKQKEEYNGRLWRKIQRSSSQTYLILKELEKLGLVEVQEVGKRKYYRLSEKGLALANHIQAIKKILEVENGGS